MTKRRLICVALLLLVSSCTQSSKAPAEPAALQHIFYHRTGGIAGVDDRVEIQPDGRIGVIRRNERPREFQLTRDQIALLHNQLSGFASLESHYPKPERIADDFQYVLRYGGRTVTASDANPNVPDKLRIAWQSLDAIALQGE
jgi:hypothetical protein